MQKDCEFVKSSVRNFICLLILLSLNTVYGQFYKNFGIELAENFSIAFNKGEFVNQKFNYYRSTYIDTIFDQRPYKAFNYNFTLTYTLYKKHTIGLKLGRNNTGMVLDGKSRFIGSFEGDYSYNYVNFYQEMEVSTIGLNYKYAFAIDRNYVVIGIGIDRQKIKKYDIIVFFKNFESPNYSALLSVGYEYVFNNHLRLFGRCYTNNSFASNEYPSIVGLNSSFSPLQYGVEFGIKAIL